MPLKTGFLESSEKEQGEDSLDPFMYSQNTIRVQRMHVSSMRGFCFVYLGWSQTYQER